MAGMVDVPVVIMSVMLCMLCMVTGGRLRGRVMIGMGAEVVCGMLLPALI
jgi:hypothetical protein